MLEKSKCSITCLSLHNLIKTLETKNMANAKANEQRAKITKTNIKEFDLAKRAELESKSNVTLESVAKAECAIIEINEDNKEIAAKDGFILQKRLAPLSSLISKAVGILDFQQMTVLTLFGFQSIGRKFQNMT